LVGLVCIVLVGCGADEQAPRTIEKLGVPNIAISPRDEFTLPCPRGRRQASTTVGIEGCAGEKARQLETRINILVRRIFERYARIDATSPTGGGLDFAFRGSARARFIRAERSWWTYRNASCASAADTFAGGSNSLVYEALCFVRRDATHLKDLQLQDRAGGN
jgi:uncharacterized protein YecT (DUF1311 family)